VLIYVCNKQISSYKCGYYVMQWMITIVHAHITTNWNTVIFVMNQILCNFVFLYTNWT